MAKEDVLAFWEKVGEDDSLRGKLESDVALETGWDGVIAFASANGFAFSVDDYAEAVESLPKDLSNEGYQEWKDGKGAELDEAALEQVAGGVSKVYSNLRLPSSPLRFGSPIRKILRPYGRPGAGWGPIA